MWQLHDCISAGAIMQAIIVLRRISMHAQIFVRACIMSQAGTKMIQIAFIDGAKGLR